MSVSGEFQRARSVPLRGEYAESLANAADALADLVTELAKDYAPRFPLLADSLRGNVALTDPTEYAWLPTPGPKTKWGRLANVGWVDQVALHRAGTTPLGAVHVSENLLGHQLEITVRGSERRAATITLKAETGEDAAQALAANVRGGAACGGKVSDLGAISVPIHAEDMVDTYAADEAALLQTVQEYREHRSVIDDNLAAML